VRTVCGPSPSMVGVGRALGMAQGGSVPIAVSAHVGNFSGRISREAYSRGTPLGHHHAISDKTDDPTLLISGRIC